MMRNIRRLLFVWLLSTTILSFGSNLSIKQTIEEMIQGRYPDAAVSALFQDAQTGKVLYQHQSKKLLSPASNMKVFLAVAAWYQLGPDFRFKTRLYQENKTLYIHFSGDPSLTSFHLDNLLQQVSFTPTRIVIDNSDYQAPYHPAGITFDDLGWYFEAPSQSVIIDGNAEEYYLSSTRLGGPVRIESKTTNPSLKIINQLKTVTWQQAKNDCDMHVRTNADNEVVLYGCMAQRNGKKRIHLATPNPVRHANQIIRTAIRRKHPFQGSIEVGKVPPNAKLIASHQSDNLTHLLTFMLQKSDNLYADSLTKQLGKQVAGEASYIQGARAIKKVLKKHTSVDTAAIKLSDGQGTRYNLITTKQMNHLLSSIWHDKALKTMMLNALPKMGQSGTVADRLRNSPLKGHISAKTGSMHDISSLAGFITIPGHSPIIFSMIMNNIHGNVHNAKAFEDKVLLEFMRHKKA